MMKRPIGTLQYAPPAPPSWKRRAGRWMLLVAAFIAVVAVMKPAYESVQRRFDMWRLSRATDACLNYSFPAGVTAYCEGDDALALRNASLDSHYLFGPSLGIPAAAWSDTPVRDFNKYYSRITGRVVGNGVIFVGAMTNASGARRLIVLSVGSDGRKFVQLSAAVFDPTVPGGVPILLPLQYWSLSRESHRLISFMPGRVEPANSNRIVVNMGFGGEHRDTTFTLDGADHFHIDGGFGWRDGGDWWLDTADQELLTLDTPPTQVRLFDGITGFAVPVAVVRREREIIGAYQRGVRAAHASTQQSWTIQTILDWPTAAQQNEYWMLRAAPDGSAIFAGVRANGFPAIYRLADKRSIPVNIPNDVRYDAVFDPDSARLYIAHLGNSTSAWSLDGRQLWRTAIESEHISAAAGVLAIVVWKQGNTDWRIPAELALLSAEDGTIQRHFTTPSDEDCVAVSPDGKRLAVATESEWLIRDANTGETRDRSVWPQLAFHWAQPCWLPDGQRVAIAGTDHVYIWDLRQPQAIYRLPIPPKDPRSHAISISPDGHWLTVASAAEPNVQIWDLQHVLPAHPPATTQSTQPAH